MSCVMCHVSHVKVHVSHVTCHMSCVTCPIFFCGGGTKWWSLLVEGLLSTGPTLSSFQYKWADVPEGPQPKPAPNSRNPTSWKMFTIRFCTCKRKGEWNCCPDNALSADALRTRGQVLASASPLLNMPEDSSTFRIYVPLNVPLNLDFSSSKCIFLGAKAKIDKNICRQIWCFTGEAKQASSWQKVNTVEYSAVLNNSIIEYSACLNNTVLYSAVEYIRV